jgi:hypothetical protein
MDTYHSARQIHTLDQQLNGTVTNPISIGHGTHGMMVFGGHTATGVFPWQPHFMSTEGVTFIGRFSVRVGEPLIFPLKIFGSETSGNAQHETGMVGLY